MPIICKTEGHERYRLKIHCLILEVRRTAVRMTPNDGACWVRAYTFVIDAGVTSIGNAFDCGSAGIGEITFLELDLREDLRLTYTLITTTSKNRVEQHIT